jgi:hypothetical protein
MEDYQKIIVESYQPEKTSGLHGKIHIRPTPGQDPFTPDMHVECSKDLSRDYPIGTKFLIKAKITSRQGESEFIYSHYNWSYEVLK